MKMINDCDDCHYYEYIRCFGNDCVNIKAPNERNDEPLAENRHENFPKWCPMKGQTEKYEWAKK